MRSIEMKRALMSIALVVGISGSGNSLAAPASDTDSARIERLEAAVISLEKRISELEGASTESPREVQKFNPSADWKIKSNWRLLSRGMTKEQVKNILGEPEKVRANGVLEHWHWKYPSGPHVMFYDDRLDGWDEK